MIDPETGEVVDGFSSAKYGGRLTRAQINRLLRPVAQERIEAKQGLSYMPQHEARAELVRIFGPGNADHTMSRPVLLYEYSQDGSGTDAKGVVKNAGKQYWITAYMCGCTLRVRDYWGRPVYECTEWHVEENSPLPNRGEAHAMAVTSVQSYALRRALISLGDAFGLHLYDKGSTMPLIKGTLELQGDPDSPLAQRPPEPSGPAAGPATPGSVQRSADGGTQPLPEPPVQQDEQMQRLQSALKTTNIKEVTDEPQ